MEKKESNSGAYIVFFVCLIMFVVYGLIANINVIFPRTKLGEYDEWVIYETKKPDCDIDTMETIENGYAVTYKEGCDRYIIKNNNGRYNFFDMVNDNLLTKEEIDGIFKVINDN